MAGLDGLTSQSLGSSTTLNWTWFIELVVCGILVIWFVFYLNRLLATVISYCIRAYTWHKFRVYIDIQAIQFSLLGGRVFFKGFQYHGENETIFIHNGHLTWRYWLHATKQVDLTTERESAGDTKAAKDDSTSDSDSFVTDSDSDADAHRASAAPRKSPEETRLLLWVNGLEWFIYNRTPLYDAIVKDAGARASSEEADTSDAGAVLSRALGEKIKQHRRKKAAQAEDEAASAEKDATDLEDELEESKDLSESSAADGLDGLDHVSTHSDDDDTATSQVTWFHAFVLRLFPFGIECAKGAISLGNEHTKALIVTTFDKATGAVDAAASGPMDIYKQLFDFDIEHPVVQMKPNPDYNLPQMAAAERIITGTKSVLKRHPWYRPNLHLARRQRKFVRTLRSLLPGASGSVESLHGQGHTNHPADGYSPFEDAQPDTNEWHGLDRYMDEDDGDEHFAWANIEYGRFSTILDAPRVHLIFYWDTPGKVKQSQLSNAPTGLAKDINGIEPPGYGLHLDVYGAEVNYGPWADRLRAELQGIFLPSGYKSAEPKKQLKVGDWRLSSVMEISVHIHDEVTLRVPSRESSKDWHWRGRATAVRDAAALRQQQHRKHFRFRRNAKRKLRPDIRPFGWLAVSVSAGSKVKYIMDMYAGATGYKNELTLTLKETKATSSVNHAELWKCKEQQVVADISNPLGWNELHTWSFRIVNKSMDLFLLRDHTFLLLDLINDFTAGQKSEYMTFMPFRYVIDIGFDNFNLMLNANDYNIIDNPCDLDENTFLVLGFENLAGTVNIPMMHFSPAQSSVSFDGAGQNASLKLKTPLWNTLRAFTDYETMATLKSLHLTGAYNYFTSTSPQLTDSLVMNIHGGQPRFNLQGYLIRYFMNVKENYFGDHIRFSTLEEYQAKIDPDARPNAEDKKPPAKKQNDLDVILSVTAEESCALMPASIYGREENLRIDVMFIEADMRFTNYYMDLQVNSSPVEVSIEQDVTSNGKTARNTSKCQLFIDGLAAYGHRLFGAPPTEPTYVCNWDFDVGKVTGECSTQFLKIMINAILAFIFTMDDDENALPDTNPVVIPDITFLRLRAAGLSIWLVGADTAFLIEIDPTTVMLNDWANRHFSKSLQVACPNIIVAALDARAAYRQRDHTNLKVPTFACLQTSIQVALLNRKPEFSHNRLQQQTHVNTNDLRTQRTPWLLDPDVKVQAQQRNAAWAREPPAMPVPNMPRPVTSDTDTMHRSRSRNSTFLDSSSRPGQRTTETSRTHISPPRYHESYKVPGLPKENESKSAIAMSSRWAQPKFHLQAVRPDLSHMPPRQGDHASSVDNGAEDQIPDEDYVQMDEEVKHDGVFVKLEDGLRGFCTPEIVKSIVSVLEEMSPQSPNAILDHIQMKTVSNIKLISAIQPGTVDDLALHVPSAHIRVICPHKDKSSNNGFDQYEVKMGSARATVRLAPKVVHGRRQQYVLAYMSIASLEANAAESLPSDNQLLSAAEVSVGDIGLWLSLQSKTRVRAQVSTVEVASAGKNIQSIAGLVQRTQTFVQQAIAEFDALQSVSRQRHFVYHLALQKNVQDPAFLNRPAYVLRTARDHVRLSDSWKILTRLRTNWMTMKSSPGSDHLCPADCALNEGADESKRHVLSAFNQWKSWEGTSLDDAAVVQAIFGAEPQQAYAAHSAIDTEVEVLVGRLSFTLDPGPSQTQIAVQNVDLNVADKLIAMPKRDWSFSKQERRQQTIQIYCGDASIHVHWEILQFATHVLHLSSSQHTAPKASSKVTTAAKPQDGSMNLTVCFGADLVSLGVQSRNLKVLLGSERLRSSLVIADTKSKQIDVSLTLSAASGRLRITSAKKVLMGCKIATPNIYASSSLVSRADILPVVHLAATTEKLRLHLREDLLGIVRVANMFINDDLRDVKSLMAALPRNNTVEPPPVPVSGHRIPQIHVAMILNDYRLELKLMPYLRYTIAGTIARTSVVPQGETHLTFHVDLKENQHSFDSIQSEKLHTVESFLNMPPLNLRVSLGLAPDEVSLDVTATLEVVRLQASAVRACFDAAYKPQTAQYVKEVKANIENLQEATKRDPQSSRQSSTRTSAGESRRLRYHGHAILAGIDIYCRAPPRRDGQLHGSEVRLLVGTTSFSIHNHRPDGQGVFPQPQFRFILSSVKLGMYAAGSEKINYGSLKTGFSLMGGTIIGNDKVEIQKYRAVSNGTNVELYAATALLVVDMVSFLQERIAQLSIAENAKKAKPFRRLTMSVADARQVKAAQENVERHLAQDIDDEEREENTLLDYIFSLDINSVCVRWYVSEHAPFSPTEAAESLSFSIEGIDLKTRRESSARLAIIGLQLQLVPKDQKDAMARTANSALLPEMIFNAAYMKSQRTRRFAFKAAGKAVNVKLAADFIVPASKVQRSLGVASKELRSIKSLPASAHPDADSPQLPKLLGNKRLASFLVFAEFAGAEATITPIEERESPSAFGMFKGQKLSRAGRYGQAVQSGSGEEATLKAPGIALQIRYRDDGDQDPSLSTEVRVAASSNTLAPSVVPLLRQISASVSDVMGQSNSAAKAEPEKPSEETKKDVNSAPKSMGDPTAILGKVKLNAGLWVQKQEFSLTCQPIARVSATAKFDEIFVTANTVQGSDHERFFSIMTTFSNLSASVQHVYSRESTASFHVKSIMVSLMNSKHFSSKSGISAILDISPIEADLNAKQMQDFLLFREIWYPAELRSGPKLPSGKVPASAPGTAAIQRYQEATVNNALPWHAIVSVQEVNLQIDFGQSIGKSKFIVSKLWASSKKNSDSEQNLCIGFERVGIESSGRLSGFVELQRFRVRTAIRWPMVDEVIQAPLVQGSVGFEHLKAKTAFDYQPFTVADISSFEFLMYNVRQTEGKGNDRLVGILDGGKIQVFCTTMTATQGLSIFQAFERLVQEKQEAFEASLHELDRYLRRRSVSSPGQAMSPPRSAIAPPVTRAKQSHAPHLQVDVVITLRAIDAGVFPDSFFDATTLKLQAVDVSSRFAVGQIEGRTHSGLGMTLGQVRVALSSVNAPTAQAVGDVSIDEIIGRATTARGGTILKVPRLVASMETWQEANSKVIEYIFRSTFQGKVDVGWNYSRISAIRRMWETHSRAFSHKLGKPLPPSAVKITAEPKDDGSGKPGQEKITAVVNMPKLKYEYVALEPPVIDTPQLRDLGDATPSLEWIGLHRERLPHVTHSVIIVSLLEVAKEVEDSYSRILGSN